MSDKIYISEIRAIYPDYPSETRVVECDPGTVSDGYHTFNELYEHRSLLFCALSQQVNSERCWKYKNKWIDGEVKPCHDGWFVACIHLDAGQVSCHMQTEYWSSFRGVDLDRPPAHDGHTSSDVILRLKDFCKFPSHRLQGRPDRWCEVCNLPDRDSIHSSPPLSGDEIDQMPVGLDLDKLVARMFFNGSVEPYSTEMASAWKIVEAGIRFSGTAEGALGFELQRGWSSSELKWEAKRRWLATFTAHLGLSVTALGDTAPLAICRAAIKTGLDSKVASDQ